MIQGFVLFTRVRATGSGFWGFWVLSIPQDLQNARIEGLGVTFGVKLSQLQGLPEH